MDGTNIFIQFNFVLEQFNFVLDACIFQQFLELVITECIAVEEFHIRMGQLAFCPCLKSNSFRKWLSLVPRRVVAEEEEVAERVVFIAPPAAETDADDV
jgi:hypothetical protein